MAHSVMEVEKFHNLTSVNWMIRYASEVMQSESKGLRIRDQYNSESPRIRSANG